MQNTVIAEKTDLRVIIMSLLFAFFSDIKCMTSIVKAYGIASEGSSVMTLLYIGIVALIFYMALRCRSLKINNYGNTVLLLMLYCVLLYYITDITVGPGSVALNFFIVFAVIAVSIPSIIKVDAKIVVKGIMCFPSIGILKVSELFAPEYNGVAITMGQSYAFIVPVLATVIYLFLYLNQETSFIVKILMLAVCFINIIYLSQLIMFGSRGPLVCFLGLLLFLLVFKVNHGVIEANKRFIVIGIILLVAGFLLLDKILGLLFSLSGDVYAIEKFINLSQSGDVSNGRDLVYKLSWDGFMSSPIFGNGFAQFSKNTSEPYPHNSILQILYDGGLIFAALLFAPLVKRLKRMTKEISLSQYTLIVLFMFAGFIGSLFSDDLWMQPMLWLFFGLVLTNNKYIYNE